MVFYSYLYDKLKAERREAWEAEARAKGKAEGIRIAREERAAAIAEWNDALAKRAIKLAEMRVKLAELERGYGIAPNPNDMAVALAEMGVSIARLNFKTQIYPSEEQIDSELADLDPRIEAVNRKRDAEIAAESGSD